MRPVTVTGTIHAEVGDVYDFLLDCRNDREWCPLASGTELVEGEPGLGAEYVFQQQMGPTTRPVRIRTTVADRPGRLAWRTPEGAKVGYRSDITLTDNGDGTTTMRQTNQVHLPFPASAAWWASANVVLRRQLRNLDEVLSSR